MENNKKQQIIGLFKFLGIFTRLADFLIIYGCGHLVSYFYFHIFLNKAERYHWLVFISGILAISLFSNLGLYNSYRGRVAFWVFLRKLFSGFLILFFIIVSYFYTFHRGYDFSRLWCGFWLLLSFISCFIIRLVFLKILEKIRASGADLISVSLVGKKELCRKIYRSSKRNKIAGYEIKEVFLTDADDANFTNVNVYKFNKNFKPESQEIWIMLPVSQIKEVLEILKQLKFSTQNIRFFPDLSEFNIINHQQGEIFGYPMMNLSVSPMSNPYNRLIKRLEDLIISTVALVISSPLFVIISIWILIISGRPIFYKQQRVSWNNEVFSMLKFRTMPVNNEANGIIWGGAAKKDTIFGGRLLRKLSLDELPQLINVLKGEMSVVGPRPERVEFVQQFQNEISQYAKKHLVKAGMTGWAQINGLRGDTDLEQRINFDIYYIDRWSLWFDLKILALTVIYLLTSVFFDKKAI